MSRDGPLIQTGIGTNQSSSNFGHLALHEIDIACFSPWDNCWFLTRCASRRGLIVGFLRIFCNWTCTHQRFQTEGYQQMCRVECPNEFGSLSIVNVFQQDTMLCFGLLYVLSLNFTATGLR